MNYKKKLEDGFKAGVYKGWSGYLWILKILVPISFMTLLIEYSGVISRLDFLLEPLMGLLYLPPEAALPLIIGMLTGIYGAVASMAVFPFTVNQMTLMAVFLLISHGLIQEGIIQGKSGMHPLKATVCRLFASVVTVLIVAQFLDTEAGMLSTGVSGGSASLSFGIVLKDWLMETLLLAAKIFVIIMVLMVILGIMKSFDLITHIVSKLRPVLKVHGLDESVGILWLTALIFGISYGAAVIVEETKEGRLTQKDLTKLHLSIGINHAMVEDPALFLPLGLPALWLWAPRLIAAIVAVQALNLWTRFASRKKGETLIREP